jgi:hypothetical protein
LAAVEVALLATIVAYPALTIAPPLVALQPSAPVEGLPLTRPSPTLYWAGMPLPLGFVPPCLPTKAAEPPTGGAWLHEIRAQGRCPRAALQPPR